MTAETFNGPATFYWITTRGYAACACHPISPKCSAYWKWAHSARWSLPGRWRPSADGSFAT